MIYSKCAVCGAGVYRYSADGPRQGEVDNAGQDCWAAEATHADHHLPSWTEP